MKDVRADDECDVATTDENSDADSDDDDPLEARPKTPSSSSRRTPGRVSRTAGCGCRDETDCSRCLSGPAAEAPVSKRMLKKKKAICMMKICPICDRTEGKSDERRDRIEKGAEGGMGVGRFSEGREGGADGSYHGLAGRKETSASKRKLCVLNATQLSRHSVAS